MQVAKARHLGTVSKVQRRQQKETSDPRPPSKGNREFIEKMTSQNYVLFHCHVLSISCMVFHDVEKVNKCTENSVISLKVVIFK